MLTVGYFGNDHTKNTFRIGNNPNGTLKVCIWINRYYRIYLHKNKGFGFFSFVNRKSPERAVFFSLFTEQYTVLFYSIKTESLGGTFQRAHS